MGWNASGVCGLLGESVKAQKRAVVVLEKFGAHALTDVDLRIGMSHQTRAFVEFDDDERVRSGLLRVWQTLRRGADPWTAALWMCVPAPDLGGLTAAGYLAEDASDVRLEYVTMLADLDSERWLQ